MYPGTPGILRRNGVGQYILLLHVYTIPIYTQDCPRIARVSWDSWDTQTQWGWTIYSYNYFMCPGILCPGLQRPAGLSQDCRCIPGLLGYSDTVGLDDIYTLTSCVYYSYIPQDCPRIACVYPGTPGILRRNGIGRYSYSYFMCPGIIIPIIRQDHCSRNARISQDSWDTQTQWGWTI